MIDRKNIRREILDFMQTCDWGVSDLARRRKFNRLALELFEYQFSANPAYARLCQKRGAAPGKIDCWREIPAVMTTSFKHVDLFCGDAETEAAHVFLTSGTTQQVRGRHLLRELALYKIGALRFFKQACLPDAAAMPVLLLGPSAKTFPDSSLGHMFSWILENFGAADSIAAFDPDGVDAEAALTWLAEKSRQKQPVMILATSLALLALVENEAFPGKTLALPRGSRMVDTGGYKASGREIAREVFLEKIAEAFGLARKWIFNEYGMTELCSQFYESVFIERAFGIRYKMSPPWMKSLACDPETLAPLPKGEKGVLRHFDLANLDSVAMIQTEDLGAVREFGVELFGRDPASEPRGCSLLAEEIVGASI